MRAREREGLRILYVYEEYNVKSIDIYVRLSNSFAQGASKWMWGLDHDEYDDDDDTD